jgi:alpha-L-fucosidase
VTRSIKSALCLASSALLGTLSSAGDLPIAAGSFNQTPESLKQYAVPDWFRDAKFGIWAHWGPLAVPRAGDWYAQKMYQFGGSEYQYHLAHYGHPSQFGYKDIIPLWKAEKWDPEKLMALYKKAGAKYFVSMGSHHDNFFLWNSKIHRWNSVAMGPKKDIVGIWQKAAQKEGLRFGVSEHLAVSYLWFQSSHGSDPSGEKAGIPYDGNDPKNQDLYYTKATPDGKGWFLPNPENEQYWNNCIRELVDTYHPDLLYSDSPLPFGDVGRGVIAHFYNQNLRQHGGKLEAVYNCKEAAFHPDQPPHGMWVEDLERGGMAGINPHPWQMDTSIGDWFYRTGQTYKSATEIIQLLVDVVSKNGNLLINIVQTPEGDLEPDMLATLDKISKWIALNGEGIYGTRPFHVYGQGPTKVVTGSMSEGKSKFSAEDIRFTTKGDTLYAFCLGIPKGEVVIDSLAKGASRAEGEIRNVSLLGYGGNLAWKQGDKGLVITMPEKFTGTHAAGFRITGLKKITWDEVK